MSKSKDSLRNTMATDPRDWSLLEKDAWIYGIVVGWGKSGLDEVCFRHGWGGATRNSLEWLHAEFRSLSPLPAPPVSKIEARAELLNPEYRAEYLADMAAPQGEPTITEPTLSPEARAARSPVSPYEQASGEYAQLVEHHPGHRVPVEQASVNENHEEDSPDSGGPSPSGNGSVQASVRDGAIGTRLGQRHSRQRPLTQPEGEAESLPLSPEPVCGECGDTKEVIVEWSEVGYQDADENGDPIPTEIRYQKNAPCPSCQPTPNPED